MEDGLYIAEGERSPHNWVADVDFELTLQANDLSKPDSLQSSYTNSATLPDTNAVRQLLRGCEQIDAGGPNPYQKLDAYVIKSGLKLFRGSSILKSFAGGWTVELSETKQNLLDQLAAKSLRHLNLSHLNHDWNIPTIDVLNKIGTDVCYPLIDYGTMGPGNVPYDALFPSVRVTAIVGQMLLESGYRAIGDWVSDPLYKAMAIPFSEAEATGHDQKWVDDRTARVTLVEAEPLERRFDLVTNQKVSRIQPFTVDSSADKRFSNGSAKNYRTAITSYVADQPMRLKVNAYQEFMATVDVGALEVKLICEVNGTNRAQGYWSKGGPYNQYREYTGLKKKASVTLDTFVDLKANDSVRIRLEVGKRTNVTKGDIKLYQTPDTSHASFIPDNTIKFGDKWPVAGNLPEMKCRDLLLSIAFMMQGWFRIDDLRKTIELVKVSDQVKQPPKDISTLVNEAVEPVHTPSIGGYGQRNFVKWREAEEVVNFSGGKSSSNSPQAYYGDGVIGCDANTLPNDAILFTLPFSASIDSKTDVTGYGRPLFIETRTVNTPAGGQTSITKKSAGARLILIEPTKTFSVPTKIRSGESLVDATVTLVGAWFGVRPETIRTEENAFTLCFDRVQNMREQSLIERYFTGLKLILRRPRTFEVSLYLRPNDLMNLDLAQPVQLQMVRIGAQAIGTARFLISQVKGWKDGHPVNVILTAY
ncbi:hypothetical protein GCM10027347_61370 [Larkinella harenae]